tara:strand:- start:251 stop:484 length:234 start_codon:yes stop_codon:yes gene_type:complete
MKNCIEIRAQHNKNDRLFLSVKTSSPKKYQVNGMNIKYPIANVTNLIDHNGIVSYRIIVAFANISDTMGPNIKAIRT